MDRFGSSLTQRLIDVKGPARLGKSGTDSGAVRYEDEDGADSWKESACLAVLSSVFLCFSFSVFSEALVFEYLLHGLGFTLPRSAAIST